MDRAWFESVAEKYLDSVYRAAVNYCKNADDAADAVQNAFFKLMTTNTVFEDDEHGCQEYSEMGRTYGY